MVVTELLNKKNPGRNKWCIDEIVEIKLHLEPQLSLLLSYPANEQKDGPWIVVRYRPAADHIYKQE